MWLGADFLGQSSLAVIQDVLHYAKAMPIKSIDG